MTAFSRLKLTVSLKGKKKSLVKIEIFQALTLICAMGEQREVIG